MSYLNKETKRARESKWCRWQMLRGASEHFSTSSLAAPLLLF